MIYLYSLLFLIYFLNLFVQLNVLSYMIGILAIISWLFSLKGSSLLFRVISIIFVLVGTGVFFVQGRDVTELPLYMSSTIPLLAVFFVLPFINSIIIVGRYDQQVSKLLKVRVRHLGQLYGRTSFVSFLLGSLLNLATLPLVNAVVQKIITGKPKKIKSKFISQAMLRGYTFSIVVSPMELLVILSVEYTHITYLHILPWLVVATIILLVINWIIGFLSYKKIELGDCIKPGTPKLKSKKYMSRKIVSLIIYLIIFMTVIIILNQIFHFGFMQTISLIIVPFSLLWALSIKRFKSYMTYSIPLWKNRTRGLKDNLVLFLAVGFFTSNLSDSSFLYFIQEPFTHLSGYPIFLFLSIQLVFLGLALVGFHPLVTISILGAIIEPIIQLLNPLSIALVLAFSALSTTSAGPFNVSVSLTGTLLNVSSYRVSYWNIGFALLFSSMGTILALCLL